MCRGISGAATILLTAAVAWAGPGGEPDPAAELTILAGGDVTLGYHLPEFLDEMRRRGEQDEEVLRNYAFRHVAARTRAADIFWINLEGTLTRHTEAVEKNFNFRADPGDVKILVEAGVDVVCLANNHAFDFGVTGLQETLATLKKAGLAAYGAGMDLAAARQPAVLRRGGLSLGFLGYVYLGPASVEPAEIYATPTRPGVAGTHGELSRLTRWVESDVRALRERVDLVLISFHWGRESSHVVQCYQRRLARAAAGAGADLIVGHHPHTLQGREQIGGTFVAYSLGNLVFAGNWNPTFKDAALLELRVTPAPAGRPGRSIRYLPIAVDNLPDFPFQPWFLEGDDAARVLEDVDCFSTATEETDCAPIIESPDTDLAAAPEPPRD